MTKITAFIPARGGSKGIPRKNLSKFGDKSLLGVAISEAQKSSFITSVIVDTDDDEIAAEAERYGAKVHRRPDELGTDVAEVDPTLIHSVGLLNEEETPDLMVLLYCTAPLRTVDDIDAAIELVISGEYDCALTLVEDHSYLWKRTETGFVPTNYVPAKRAARQTEGWNQFVENKAVYVFHKSQLLASGCRINGKVGAVTMPVERSIDIDSIDDLRLAASIAGVEYSVP